MYINAMQAGPLTVLEIPLHFPKSPSQPMIWSISINFDKKKINPHQHYIKVD